MSYFVLYFSYFPCSAKIDITILLVKVGVDGSLCLSNSMPTEYRSICKDLFAKGGALYSEYHLVVSSHTKKPFTMVLKKLPGYSSQAFRDGILNRRVAEVMEDSTCDHPHFAIHVHMSQLDNQENVSDGVSDSSSTRISSSTESSESGNDTVEDDDNYEGGELVFSCVYLCVFQYLLWFLFLFSFISNQL